METGQMAPAGAGASATPPSAEEGGFVVCIKSAADGALSVGVQRPGAEPNYQPAGDRKAALTMALEILKAGGAQADQSAAEAEADLAEGFGQPKDLG